MPPKSGPAYCAPLALLLMCMVSLDAQSPPGKPTLTKCRSYDKETFSCWWEPGSDGGLPTNYTLSYWTERNNTRLECPDYRTSGPNSCYFDNAHASRRAYYYVYVTATNALGSSTSETFPLEVVGIVEPNPPRNLTLAYEGIASSVPCLWIRWFPPEKPANTMTWPYLLYELRLRDQKTQEWEYHITEQQTRFKVFSVTPGENYVVQVRCKTDTGFWSEWCEERSIQIPGVLYPSANPAIGRQLPAGGSRPVDYQPTHFTGQKAPSPPGKPTVTKCRSYEKETFTCWWEPGSDGGLPTNYTLFYWTEKNNTHLQCPDYRSSGPNSCYFDKAHSSIWVFYYVYVKATNALGSSTSETFQLEVVDILEPYPPRNLTLAYEGNTSSLPYLFVKWNPPEKADFKIGWLTFKYEVRLKDEKKQDWENHIVDQQTKLKVFGLTPGGNYVVQVRCKAETGFWSEWCEESYVEIPGDLKQRDLTLWISVAVLSVIICLTMIWAMALKGCSWVSCICPPVPGPKIMGFDTQLLKSGKSDDLLSALGCQGFPPTSDCEDLLVEFLEVDDSKEHLISSPEKEPQNLTVKASPADTDNDSGRGSCDSPFAPSEGPKDQRVPSVDHGVHSGTTKCSWPPQNELMASTTSNFSDKKSYIWADGMASGNQSPKSSYHNITDVCKMALSAMNANMPAFLLPNEEKSQPRYFRTVEKIEEENLKQSDLGDLHSNGVDIDKLQFLLNKTTAFMPPRTVDYVEVHKVNQNNALSLLPKHKESGMRTDQYSILVPNKEYSKVERVESDNILVLMQNLETQVSPLNEDVMKDFLQKPHSHQAENRVGLDKPVQQNKGGMQTAGMGYMDPSCFFP